MYHVCENLKRLREERGLSIRALAREVGITHYTIGAYERQKIVPSLENGFKLAEFFDIPIEYLVKGEKVNTNFNDSKLLELFRTVDEMSREERIVVKKYLQKFISNRMQWTELRDEAEE
jgi:transcriptional regulator with XRE-family HTH domain